MKKSICLTLVLLISLFFSCFTNEENKDDQIEINKIIPPASTMMIDFSEITSVNDETGKTAQKCYDKTDATCAGAARLVIGLSNAIFYTPFAIPVSIYRILQNQPPTNSTENHVEWVFTHEHNGSTLTVSVIADYFESEDEWGWTLKIDEFTWLTGASRNDKTSGWWQFHQPLQGGGSKETVGVVWEYNSETDTTVTFMNNDVTKPSMDDDFVEYKRSGNDISVTFYDECNSILNTEPCNKQLTRIYWNIETKAGGIDIKINDEDSSSCTWNPND